MGGASRATRARWGLALAAQAAVLTWSAGRYGYHRDELYFLACGRHPAWGYPDQPPLTPLLARAAQALHPGSPTALRLPAVLAVVLVTVLTALITRDLGGGPVARGLAAFAVATGAVMLTSGRLLATSTLDLAVWVALTWVAVRLLATGDRRWWLAAGAVLGVGLLNKQLPLLLVLGVVVGVLLTPSARPLLRGPWVWAGGAVALACWAPVLLWQARNGWPQLTLAGQISDEYGQPGKRLETWIEQLALFSLGATVLWALGVRHLFGPLLARFRPLGWAWLVVMAVFAVTAGQVYYPGGLYPALIAAGAVAVERWRRRGAVVAVLAGVAVTASLVVPAALPVLSPAALDRSPWRGLGEAQREMVGWPQLVDQVATAYRSLPAAQQPRAVVFTGNYGEAGAVELYGPSHGVPAPVYSGHNGFAAWGPPPDGAGPVVVVWESGPAGAPPSRWFAGCTSFGPVVTGVRNEESTYASVWTCSAPLGGWGAAWPRLTHLSA